jgi:hypothetical protein
MPVTSAVLAAKLGNAREPRQRNRVRRPHALRQPDPLGWQTGLNCCRTQESELHGLTARP